MLDLTDLDSASLIRPANQNRERLVLVGSVWVLSSPITVTLYTVTLPLTGVVEIVTVVPKHMQLCRPLALHSLLLDMKAYLNGAPSLSAVGGFGFADSSNTVNRRDSRNALNVTHFEILPGSKSSCRSVQESIAEIVEACSKPLISKLCLSRSRMREGDMSVQEGRTNTGPQETTWAFISRLSG